MFHQGVLVAKIEIQVNDSLFERLMGKFEKYKFERPSFMDRPNYKSIGYSRVSTSGQIEESQVADLKKEGCFVVLKKPSVQESNLKSAPN